MRELFLLEEPHSKLTKGVECEEANVWIVVATDLYPCQKCISRVKHCTYLIEMLPEDIPQVRPFETDASHIIVRNLHELLKTE